MSSIDRRSFLRGGLAATAMGTTAATAACSSRPVVLDAVAGPADGCQV